MLKKIYNPFLWLNSKPQQLVKQNELLPDEFTSCADLPMSRFIKVTVTGDLSYLGRCAEPEKLWEAIHSEYTELSGDAQSSRGLELAKQMSFLTNKINITNSIVQHLAHRGRIDDLVTELQNMGYRLKYIDLNKDLARTLLLSKSDHIKLSALQEQYKKLGTGEKTTDFQWVQILSALGKFRGGVIIRAEDITVMEYVAMDLDFRAHVQAMSKTVKY